MASIFISHSSKNAVKTKIFSEWLESEGWSDYYLDQDPNRGNFAGDKWDEKLKDAIRNCDIVIFLISPEWCAAHYCQKELHWAEVLGKQIFGVIIKKTELKDIPSEITGTWHFVDLTKYDDTEARKLANGLRISGINQNLFEWPPASDPDRIPYRGFRPLEEEDAAIYFGREADIHRGLTQLGKLRESLAKRYMVILGASGSGKSSLMKAGLWSRLSRDKANFFPLPIIRPEKNVISGAAGLASSLSCALRSVDIPSSKGQVLENLLTDPAKTFFTVLKTLREKIYDSEIERSEKAPTFILGLDQAEELFVSSDTAERNLFLEILKPYLKPDPDPDFPQIILLITIRTDSYEWFQHDTHFANIHPEVLDLRPMLGGAYKDCIIGPAERHTVNGKPLAIEPELVDVLLTENKGTDALPLLSFSLERLYLNYGSDGNLLLDEYEKMGGIRGSIEAAVSAAFEVSGDSIPADESTRNARLKTAFVPWLIRIDPETQSVLRRQATQDELPSNSLPLVERLVEQRLIRKDNQEGQTTYEVAHEALLRQWPLTTKWISEEKDNLRQLSDAKNAAIIWNQKDRSSKWLVHRGERLEGAKILQNGVIFYDKYIGNVGLDYLKACQVAQTKDERRNRLLSFASVSLLGLILIGAIAWPYKEALTDLKDKHTKYRVHANSANKINKFTAGTEFQDCKTGTHDCPLMVVLPEGQISIGAPIISANQGLYSDQASVKNIPTLAVSKHEITFAQWQACQNFSACSAEAPNDFGLRRRQDKDQGLFELHPVMNITWTDANAYAKWLSNVTGAEYRLLTESEWIYAASGSPGTASNINSYNWGEMPPECSLGQSHGAKFIDCAPLGTAEVGTYEANGFGLHDMHGNLSEFVSDCDTSLPEHTLDECRSYVFKGGAWSDPPSELSLKRWDSVTSKTKGTNLGFRVARVIDPQSKPDPIGRNLRPSETFSSPHVEELSSLIYGDLTTFGQQTKIIESRVRRWNYKSPAIELDTNFSRIWNGWVGAGHSHMGLNCPTNKADNSVFRPKSKSTPACNVATRSPVIKPPWASHEITFAPNGYDIALYGTTLPSIPPKRPVIGQKVTIVGYPAGSQTMLLRNATVYYARGGTTGGELINSGNSGIEVRRVNENTVERGPWIAAIDYPNEPVYSGMSGSLVIDSTNLEPLGILTNRFGTADLNNDGKPVQSFGFVALADVYDALK